MTNLATKLNRMINWVGGKVLKCSPPASLRIQVAVGLGGAIQIRVTSPSTRGFRLQSQQTAKVLSTLQIASHPIEALCAA